MQVSRALVQFAVLVAWILIGAALMRGRAQAAKSNKRRDAVSRVGLLIQAIGMGLSWMGPWWLFAPRSPSMHPALALLAVGVAFSGSFLVIAAIRALGLQWSLTARITEGHQLVTTGPYSLVRNPIYTGMWGLQLGTCMAFSAWWLGYKMLAITAVIYYAGTVLRVSREERLLRAEFGSEFDDYAHRVPAIIPLPGRRS